tara:strand:- start:1306 stop:1923 length:618 start_codon:yes stop_codon:yes gene_type:complete
MFGNDIRYDWRINYFTNNTVLFKMNILNLQILAFDYVIIALTLVIVFFYFWRGFINSILSLLTWIGSLFITIFSYKYLSSYLNNILLNIEFISNFDQFNYILSILISIPLIFLLSLFILKRIRKIISNDLDKKLLGYVLDKFFGIIYGFLFSYIIFSSVIYFTTNNDITILNNFNYFLLDSSNILKKINLFNDNVLNYFITNTEE